MFIGGNWKLNGDLSSVKHLTQAIQSGMQQSSKTTVAIFPPFVYLNTIQNLLEKERFSCQPALGAQNVSNQTEGAYTGEISATMLKDFSVRYVLIGHSERRHVYGESDDLIAEKMQRCFEAGITPILCVGETLTQREAGEAQSIVLKQIESALAHNNKSDNQTIIIAYEPVWAIGTGKVATPDEAQAMHAIIRQALTPFVLETKTVEIIYGGSMKPDNAKTLLSLPDVNGGLIGGAALKAEDFLAIVDAAGVVISAHCPT